MTEQEYVTELERLRAADAGNLLLRRLAQGATVVNILLLKKALENLGATASTDPDSPEGAPAEDEDDDIFDENDPTADATLRILRREVAALFAEENRRSDLFRTLKTVGERAENSDEIQMVQRNIARMIGRIRHYKLHKCLPEGDTGRFYVPKDGVELVKKQASLRANISRKKRDIKKAEAADLSDPRNARKLEAELDKIRDLRSELGRIDEAIKAV